MLYSEHRLKMDADVQNLCSKVDEMSKRIFNRQYNLSGTSITIHNELIDACEVECVDDWLTRLQHMKQELNGTKSMLDNMVCLRVSVVYLVCILINEQNYFLGFRHMAQTNETVQLVGPSCANHQI
jgi:hypothetical protein